MKKIIALALGLCLTLCAAVYNSADASSRVIQANGQYVFKLLSPKNPNRGGTAFQVVAPSGRTYLISNGHVCGLGSEGAMVAELGGSKRRIRVRILEIAEDTDLCILEGLSISAGLQLARGMWEKERLFVLGHPHLNDLTLSEGFPVSRQIVTIQTGDTEETCIGPGYRWESLSDIFGIPMGTCTRALDAWDTSAVIYPGNSGSPVMNRGGDVVGVIFAGHSATHYGSFVPLDVLRNFLSVY